MNKKELYTNYLSKLEKALNTDNFENIDYILESVFTLWIPEEELEEMSNILQEATLYSELKENEYKDEALRMIWGFKD